MLALIREEAGRDRAWQTSSKRRAWHCGGAALVVQGTRLLVMVTTTQTGGAAEALAARHLERQGLCLIARNVRCRSGEVDLIATHRDVLVFVEVRLRKHAAFGGAAESITTAKRRRIILAAQHWLAGAGQRYSDWPCRFDAVLMQDVDATGLEWIRDAFSVE